MTTLTAQLDAVGKLSRLLQQGPPTGPALQQAIDLVAQAGEPGALLLKQALATDACAEQRPPPSVIDCPPPPPKPHVPEPCSDCVDTTPPQTPYTRVFLGEFVDPVAPRDPLILRFSDLEKDATVWFINRRKDLGADRADTTTWQQVPWDGSLDAEGRANVVVSDAQAAALGIDGGDILEIFQTDKAGNASGSDWVAINEAAAGSRVGNPLGSPVGRAPTSWVGVQSDVQRSQLLLRGDGKPPAADGSALTHTLRREFQRCEIVLKPAPGKLALEPFSKVIVDRPPFYTGHYTQDVKRNGSFEIKASDMAAGDAVVLRVFDHSTSWKLGEGAKPTERRIVLTAGSEGGGVVVENPAAGTQKPLAASLGRICLSNDALKGEPGAATPGSIVYVVDQTTGKRSATAVAADGSFHRSLASSVGNQISVQLLHAFDAPERRVDLGIHAVTCDARPLGTSAAAVGNNDVGSGLRFQVDAFELGFSTYDWNTGNRASLTARTDWSGRAQAVTRFDVAAGEVVVQIGVSSQGAGARQDELTPAAGLQTYFGAAGRTQMTTANPEPGVFRQHIKAAGVGGSLPVRFETEDGRVVQRGRLDVGSEVRWHSTGSGQPEHPVWTAKLAPGSLVNV